MTRKVSAMDEQEKDRRAVNDAIANHGPTTHRCVVSVTLRWEIDVPCDGCFHDEAKAEIFQRAKESAQETVGYGWELDPVTDELECEVYVGDKLAYRLESGIMSVDYSGSELLPTTNGTLAKGPVPSPAPPDDGTRVPCCDGGLA